MRKDITWLNKARKKQKKTRSGLMSPVFNLLEHLTSFLKRKSEKQKSVMQTIIWEEWDNLFANTGMLASTVKQNYT